MEIVNKNKIEYFQTDFETKLCLADGFISELAVKYCEQQMKLNQPLKAVEFSKRIYRVQEVFMQIRSILGNAKFDNTKFYLENRELKRKLNEYERDDKGINELMDSTEIEERYKAEMLEFKDKYQMRIQELEIENDQLLKQLIKFNQK